MFRRKRDRFEYYFMNINYDSNVWLNPKKTRKGRDYGAFSNLGAQGWRYVGIVNGMYAFERKSRWRKNFLLTL